MQCCFDADHLCSFRRRLGWKFQRRTLEVEDYARRLSTWASLERLILTFLRRFSMWCIFDVGLYHALFSPIFDDGIALALYSFTSVAEYRDRVHCHLIVDSIFLLVDCLLTWSYVLYCHTYAMLHLGRWQRWCLCSSVCIVSSKQARLCIWASESSV